MTAGGDLEVSGGAGGAGADLDDVDAAVTRLRASAAALGDAGADLHRGGRLLQGLDGVLVDPGAALALEADLLAVVAELDAAVAHTRTLAELVAFCAVTYRTTEEVQRHRWAYLGALLSGPVPLLLGWTLTQAVMPVSRWAGAGSPEGGHRAGAAPAAPPGSGVPGQGAVLGPPSSAPAFGAPCAPARLPTTADPQLSLPPGGPLPVLAGEHPPTAGAQDPPDEGGVDAMTRAGRVAGDLEQPLVALVAGALVGPAALVAPAAPLLALRSARAGAAQGIGSGTEAVVVPTAVPPGPRASPPPAGIGGAVRQIGTVNDGSGPDGRIRVERTLHADGSRTAVVYVPGVQDWSGGSENPASLVAALRGVAGDPSAYTDAVVDAMDEAGVRPDEAVMLDGHSLGGVVAAQVAADASVRERFDVEAVLTAGSPIGAIDIPSDVEVLSLEHREDLVPHLDGLDNTALASNQVTVTASAPAQLGAHDGEAYARLGDRVDASDDPSLVSFKQATEKFFPGPGDTTEVTEVVATAVGR